MNPRKHYQHPQTTLFEIQLERLIDPKHPLAILAENMDWESLEQNLNLHYTSDSGRPAINTRLMVSIHYLKYSHNLSDREVLKLWTENPYWQYFSGIQAFTHKIPFSDSSMTRWRKRLGEQGAEELLKATITTAINLKFLKKNN